MPINATYNYTSGLPLTPMLHPASNPTTTHGQNAREGKCRKDSWIYICAMEKQNLSVWVLPLSDISWNLAQSSFYLILAWSGIYTAISKGEVDLEVAVTGISSTGEINRFIMI